MAGGGQPPGAAGRRPRHGDHPHHHEETLEPLLLLLGVPAECAGGDQQHVQQGDGAQAAGQGLELETKVKRRFAKVSIAARPL